MKNAFPLTPLIRNKLEKAITASTSPVRLVFRARIILLIGEGYSNYTVVHLLKTTFATVRKWVRRFTLYPKIETLEDAHRSGRPCTILAEAKCEVIKFACSDVKVTHPRGQPTWTIKGLQECVNAHTGVFISKSEIHRILNNKSLKPHKVKMWLHSPDPLFKEKVNKISALYLRPPRHAIVLCIDEKSGMQAIERKRSLSSIEKGGGTRLDYEYKRHGTQTLIGSFEPKTGKVFGHCGKTRKKEDLMKFMEEIALQYPNEKVYIIWDNLNIHHGYRWYEFNQRHNQRFHFVYTPVHGSWVNQIEIWFGILQRQALKNASFTSEKKLQETVLSFIKTWNTVNCHPFRWQFRGYIQEVA